MSLKDLGYKPRRTTVRIILDDNVRMELEEARAALEQWLKRPDQTLSAEHEQRVEAAEAAAEEAAVSFVFEAIPRTKLADLIAECPPTSEQLEEWKQQDRNNPYIVIDPPPWDIDTFTPRVIAASMVEPETTEAEVVKMWESGEWSSAIWTELWKAAWDKTNKWVPDRFTLGNGSKKTLVSVPASPTQ